MALPEPRKSTVGQLLINSALPAKLRDYDRVFDKTSMGTFLTDIVDKVDPDTYAAIVHKLSLIGLRSARGSNKASFTLDDFEPPKVKQNIINKLKAEVKAIIAKRLPLEEQNSKIIEATAKYTTRMPKDVYKAGLKNKNPFSLQILSGARGKEGQLSSMRGSDLLYQDHRENPIPVPIFNSYAEGLDPIEYWAGTYGARAGTVSTKFATADAGYFGKRLKLASHRLVATDEDVDPNQMLAVDVNDADNVGAILARDYGALKRGDPIDAKALKHLQSKGLDHILIFSPIAANSKSGGLPQLAAGIREKGRLVDVGDNVGIVAAQAISEPVSQGMLSSKHKGGVSKGQRQALTGFEFLEQLIEVPKTFVGVSPVTEEDGLVTGVRTAPQGGRYVKVGSKEYYVPESHNLIIKKGQQLEAGDALSDGTPNPKDYVKYKGIGEGRKLFVKQFTKALRDNIGGVHRRNVEVVARGLINQVRLHEPNVIKGYFPDDVVSYDLLASQYTPREGASTDTPKKLVGSYLEQPLLHYSIGTRITPRVAEELTKYGFKSATAHTKPPPFTPDMHRAQMALLGDPDWMTRLGGFNLKRTFLKSVQRGATSKVHGTSWIPALATGEIVGGKTGRY
jgi:DNA-directed RNA polymerase subunit beta'